ncbi:MAG: hypothetical protein B6D63_05055 [Candidatus Latescibacteria bacterium 4484_7]|nr:MAG: hypothetical protein B6D63_05055 [Candidatus Latescibacteria bacterium 4484_7]
MNAKRLVAASIGLFLLVLYAEQTTGQSIYGLNYLGEHRMRGGSRYSALGFSGLAIPDSLSILTQNAASIADIKRFTFSVNQFLSMSRIGSDKYSSNQNRFEVPSMMIAAPLRKGLVFALGYRSRFVGKGDFSFTRDVPDIPVPYEVYKHRSSLFTVPVTISAKLWGVLNLAGELQIERGSIKDETTVRFTEEELYHPAISRLNRNFYGTSWSVSALWKAKEWLSLGAVFDAGVDYGIDEVYKFSRTDFDSLSHADFSLPPAFALGAAVKVRDRWWISTTYWRRNAPEASIFDEFSGRLEAEEVVSFGLERRMSQSGGFLRRLPVRLGFYQDRWHIEIPGGEPVFSRFVTLGTAVKMPGGPGVINLDIEYGQNGSSVRNGVSEKMVRFGIGISVSEKWSKRRSEW